jgi:hypothetical protein
MCILKVWGYNLKFQMDWYVHHAFIILVKCEVFCFHNLWVEPKDCNSPFK